MKAFVRREYLYLFSILSLLLFLETSFAESKSPKIIAAKYGVDCNTPYVNENIVKSRQNLAEILLDAGVSYSTINEAVDKARKVFDVRKIKPGKSYCIIRTPGIQKESCYFIYDENQMNYVVFDLGESVDVYRDKKPVETRTRVAEGVIESSLSAAFSRQNLNYELALKLSEIYAWTLDFYHFQKGDSFRLIFEEKYIDDRPAGIGRVIASRITHNEEDFYAFYFKSDNKTGDYFDEKGNSLRNAFLKAPLKYVRISSGYTKRRLHPVLNKYREHLGVDYAAPEGTPILSVGDGIVENKAYNSTGGKYIQIRHSKKYMSQYLHMSAYAKGIKPGKRVNQGDVIGFVGSTGLATGPHLDFRFCINGKPVNFLKQKKLMAEPVKPELMKLFYARVESLKIDLDKDKTRQFSAVSIRGNKG